MDNSNIWPACANCGHTGPHAPDSGCSLCDCPARPERAVRRKLGAHRGARRLWLEGKTLTAHGFTRGTAFTATARPDGGMDIIATADGDRHVAGTDARPIIDVLTHAFTADVAYVWVTFSVGAILVCPEGA